MKSISFIASFLVFALAFVATSSAFAPKSTVSPTFATARAQKVQIQMVFNDEPERKALTRDSEPEEYFQTWVFDIGLQQRSPCFFCLCILTFRPLCDVPVIRIKCQTQRNSQLRLRELPPSVFHSLLVWSLCTQQNKYAVKKNALLTGKTNNCLIWGTSHSLNWAATDSAWFKCGFSPEHLS